MRALVVDDDSRMRRVLRAWLLNHGFGKVLEAGDGLEALECLKGAEVDLIITERRMPRMDAMDLTCHLRAAGDRTPIILIMGGEDADFLVKAIRSGVDNYISKPIHFRMLLEKVQQTLGMLIGAVLPVES